MYRNSEFVLIIFFIFILAHSVSAQKQNSVWMLPDSVKIDFKQSPISVTYGHKIGLTGNNGVISDSSGKLLFYSSINRLHDLDENLTPNGSSTCLSISSGLSKGPLFVPIDDSLIYVIGSGSPSSTSAPSNSMMQLCAINTNLNSGKGDFFMKDSVFYYSNTGKITATHHKNAHDFWVVTVNGRIATNQPWSNNNKPSDSILVFLLTEKGLKLHKSYYILPSYTRLFGDIEFSSNGSVLAVTDGLKIELYRFDILKGEISNGPILNEYNPLRPYNSDMYYSQNRNRLFRSIKFSKSGNYLYTLSEGLLNSIDTSFAMDSSLSEILQYNISSWDSNSIKQSRKVIRYGYNLCLNNSSTYCPEYRFDNMQIASDSKLYLVTNKREYDSFKNVKSVRHYLSVINTPDSAYHSQLLVDSAFFIKQNNFASTSLNYFGVPNLIHSFLDNQRIGIKVYGDTLICKGDSVKLLVTSSCSFLGWKDESNERFIYAKKQGWYIAIALNLTDTIRDSVYIHVIDVISPNVAHTFQACDGEVLKIGFDGSNYDSVYWSNGILNDTILVNSSGVFYVTVFKEKCRLIDSTNIIFNVKPLPPFIDDTLKICGSDSAMLNVTNPYDSVLWFYTYKSTSIWLSKSSFVKLRVYSGFCYNDDSVYIVVGKKPQINLPNDTFLCSNIPIELQIELFKKIVWSNGDTSNKIKVDNPGVYSVYVEDTSFCTNADTIRVTIGTIPAFSVIQDDTFCVFQRKEVKLCISPQSLNCYWVERDTTSSCILTNDKVNRIKVKGQEDCIILDTVLIYYNCDLLPSFHVPNAFSPNGDGINDVFKPDITPSTIYDYEMSIYDSWGENIFTSTDYNVGWDGRFRLGLCSEGVYYWLISYRAKLTNELVQEKGSLFLLVVPE